MAKRKVAERPAIAYTRDHLELAFIELEYLAADARLHAENDRANPESQSVAAFYRAACDALSLCLEIRERAENKSIALFA